MTASRTIARDLLDWYDVHARVLPWRVPPGSAEMPDPYQVWLSEIMLQQTTVAAVKPYFEKFVARWPRVADLAAADESEVMAEWAGLGYYSRARNLHAAARRLADDGFPQTETRLRALPGIGDYTAAAIASIAFGQRAVVVDANVERVVSRLFAIEAPLPSSRPDIRRHADAITPDERAGDFAQAMMDLGSQICTSKAPKCLLCPLRQDCVGHGTGAPETYPRKLPKKAKPVRQGTAYFVEAGNEVLLVTRPGTGLLAGMRALPDDGWTARSDGSGRAPIEADWTDCGTVTHAFTHAKLELRVRKAHLPRKPAIDGQWWPLDRLDEAGLPTLFVRAAERARSEDAATQAETHDGDETDDQTEIAPTVRP